MKKLARCYFGKFFFTHTKHLFISHFYANIDFYYCLAIAGCGNYTIFA